MFIAGILVSIFVHIVITRQKQSHNLFSDKALDSKESNNPIPTTTVVVKTRAYLKRKDELSGEGEDWKLKIYS